MEGDISAPFIAKEGKLDRSKDGQEIKKNIVSNTYILNEEVNNEQKQNEGDSKSGSKLQIIGVLEEQIAADQKENGQGQEQGMDQEQQEIIGQEQEEGTGEEQEERTDQEQVKGTGQEQEERISQDQVEGTGQEQEGRTAQVHEGRTGQDQVEETGQEQEGRTGQVHEGRTGQEQEGRADQVEKEDKQEEIGDEDDPGYVKSPPLDPAAPLNLSDSQERLKPRFELKQEQLAEIEQLWDLYQNYTPAYTDINGYITEAELVYMLKCLLLMTYTPEQLQELIAFCVRPPHPQGHITFDQFVKIATIRQRDFSVEEELRAALQVLDTGNEGMINREYLMEVLSKQGHKMHHKKLKNLMKEVDIRNDGTIGIEDVVGTICIDLTSDDMFKPKEEDEEENLDA